MKGALPFDARDYDYGNATAAVRAILGEWGEIDWFAKSAATDAHLIAHFRAHDPAAAVRVVTGDHAAFTAWCDRVRANPAWDWRFSVLKILSRDHAEVRGWKLETHARLVTAAEPPRAGDLCFRFDNGAGGHVAIWNHAMPKLDGLDEPMRFYLGYAHGDLLDALKWQLAENSSQLDGNPFVPLVRCYAAGGYPFSLDRETVVVFRFVG